MGFSVLWFSQFLDWFFGIRTVKLQFLSYRISCGLRDFLLLAFDFSVFGKYTSKFLDLVINVVLVNCFSVAIMPQLHAPTMSHLQDGPAAKEPLDAEQQASILKTNLHQRRSVVTWEESFFFQHNSSSRSSMLLVWL